MSINWVMLQAKPPGFVALPNERILYTSPPRTALQIYTPSDYNGDAPFMLKGAAYGVTYITNQRILHLCSSATAAGSISLDSDHLSTFASPLLSITDSRIRAPFFGANYWEALCRPVPGGGLPAQYPVFEIRITFKEGGAFDFHTKWEEIRERAAQARENGRAGSIVHLEQLPAYEARDDVSRTVDGGSAAEEITTSSNLADVSNLADTETPSASQPETKAPTSEEGLFPPPVEPPPGYEEVQVQAIGTALDERLREAAERGED